MALRLKWLVIAVLLAFVNNANGARGFLSRCFSASRSDERELYECITAFNRGQFERIQWLTESQANPSENYPITTAAGMAREIKCNDAYHMLSYLHMTTPMTFNDHADPDVFRLHEAINGVYVEWPKKMLATAFNVTATDTEETDVPWLVYLYFEWIKERSARGEETAILQHVVRSAHAALVEAVSTAMSENDCTKGQSRFEEYEAEMKQRKPKTGDYSTTLEALLAVLDQRWYDDLNENAGLHCFQELNIANGKVQGVQPVTEQNLTFRPLYNETEQKLWTSLLNDFNVLEDGDSFDECLKRKIADIRNVRTTSFRVYVESLANIYNNVVLALDTIMWRIVYNFAVELGNINMDLWKTQVERFSKPYNEWWGFFHLNTTIDAVSRLYERLNTLKISKYCDVINKEVDYVQSDVIFKLLENEKSSTIKTKIHDTKSLKTINFDEPALIAAASKYNISINETPLKYSTNKAIVCAKVLIQIVKNIFPKINFKAVKSLIKLGTSPRLEKF